MPDASAFAKAELIELDSSLKPLPPPKGRQTTVQFNPESLKVSFANQIVTPANTGSKEGPTTQQFVGAGTTKLALQVWFDVSSQSDGGTAVDDVRKLTSEVIYFITPAPIDPPPPGFEKTPAYRPPMVRFAWGTFIFDGIMDSLEENLDFFSSDGRPLRASVSFNLSQQRIQKLPPGVSAGKLPPLPFGVSSSGAGTKSLTPSPSGASLQSLAVQAGRGDDWQSVADANGIENPRILATGQLLDLNP
jgi:hypothetical protein